MSYLPVSPHTQKVKHRILSYYLGCVHRAKLHENWGYIETHAASGYCKDKETGKIVEGSPVLVHRLFPRIPKVFCEINKERFAKLNETLGQNPSSNVLLLEGDCNALIDTMQKHLSKVAFYFHFVDPDGVRADDGIHDQLSFETVMKIIGFRNSEIFLNFPLLPFTRWGGFCHKHPNDRKSTVLDCALTRFYGTDEWKQHYCRYTKRKWDLDGLVDRYVAYLTPFYKQPIQKFLVRSERNAPVYYLIHGTNHHLGHLFMSKAFSKLGAQRGVQTKL